MLDSCGCFPELYVNLSHLFAQKLWVWMQRKHSSPKQVAQFEVSLAKTALDKLLTSG